MVTVVQRLRMMMLMQRKLGKIKGTAKVQESGLKLHRCIFKVILQWTAYWSDVYGTLPERIAIDTYDIYGWWNIT